MSGRVIGCGARVRLHWYAMSRQSGCAGNGNGTACQAREEEAASVHAYLTRGPSMLAFHSSVRHPGLHAYRYLRQPKWRWSSVFSHTSRC